MSAYEYTEIAPITLSDGRRGTQRVDVYSDGSRRLIEIVVTSLRDGTACRQVYDRSGDVWSHVYSFGDLSGLTWEVTGETRKVTPAGTATREGAGRL